jgi:hypothetical protein
VTRVRDLLQAQQAIARRSGSYWLDCTHETMLAFRTMLKKDDKKPISRKMRLSISSEPQLATA